MRVLLAEQILRSIARELAGHDVSTVQQQGWAGVKNGELLRRAQLAGFDAFVTADRSLVFQQNLARNRLSVIVMRAPTTKSRRFASAYRQAFADTQAGSPPVNCFTFGDGATSRELGGLADLEAQGC